MNELRSDYLSKEQIWDRAEQFRTEVIGNEAIPVPILDIAEIDLQIEVRPEPQLNQIDVDGFLSHDLQTIFIQHDQYWEDRHEYRRRFTIAEEVGHYILHGDKIRSLSFSTIQEWQEFYSQLDAEEIDWFEWQAKEFAGRLLVPIAPLTQELEQFRGKIEEFKRQLPDSDHQRLKSAIASNIHAKFKVSKQSMTVRLEKENVWSDLGF